MGYVNKLENLEREGTGVVTKEKKASSYITGGKFEHLEGENIDINYFDEGYRKGILEIIRGDLEEKEKERIENEINVKSSENSEEEVKDVGDKANEITNANSSSLVGYAALSKFFVENLRENKRSKVVEKNSIKFLAQKHPEYFDRAAHKLDRLGDGKPDVDVEFLMILDYQDLELLKSRMSEVGREVEKIFDNKGIVFEINGTKLAFICTDEVEINGKDDEKVHNEDKKDKDEE